ncbi:hypothetical protein [Phosphitispora fastidiosa]|uniref:hypothetical protein n=1 Tax=Phosphitispora fastidiosa TaxID=2837202 RepID=UPI001E5A52C2|nr:hypothetical protein [Phosphitispora fastidiosa]MBU7006188.1 hypothetical protein [Phosphitispora fastidiosa]
MKNEELRSIFQREILPELFLYRKDLFYQAFNEGPDQVHALMMSLWADICNQNGDNVNNHPIEIKINYIIINDSDEDYTCLMIMEMPDLKKKPGNLAIYYAVFFGVNKDLRFFLGETDYHARGNRYIFIIELIADGDYFSRSNHGHLFQGCNNEPLLFEKPENTKTPDEFVGIDPEDEWQTFTDVVAKICLLPSSEANGI